MSNVHTTTLEHLFHLDSNVSKTVSDSENGGGLLSTICYCCIIFTFTDSTESPSEQDVKRYKLIQLLSILKSPKKHLPHHLLSPLFNMISVNIFRPLPPSTTTPNTTSELPDDEELSSTLLPAWQHLQIVYDILLRLVLNSDPKVLGDYIDECFVANLVCLFQSEDPRERESLKNVYHRIYSRLTFHRTLMRKSMTQVLLRYVFETEKHPGIAEVLEIWGSIINGFTVPVKEEHKLFLMRVLIPLHKTKGMQIYHRELSYCVNQFVQKEAMLGGIVVRGILRYWPITNSQKEIVLIGELEELVENIDPDHYRKLALPLCNQITRCLNSWNSQVAERALYVWNNEQFVKMATSAMEEVFPVVVEGMEKNLKWHWSKSVKQLTENVKLLLQQMDQTLYNKCIQDISHKQNKARQQEEIRNKRWERIEMEAAAKLQPNLLCVSH
ncbi:serine/threonine protein phosphatase 2A 57 kDa regulatory subunit B' beta isoform-like [Euphorbia lathyris]|uniref:serine/threonine protein phosphatase 2A 57 kDa regulatory subunit B' beta isoform-like n=1 Tax=Euphorbia lathyris TaxID=212925 RepID=UPI0033131082